jgi:uncharacterized protein YkwD
MRAFRVGLIVLVATAITYVASSTALRKNSVVVTMPQVLAASAELADDENLLILDMINKVRVEAGVEKLAYSRAMRDQTTDRVSDMATRQYYSHRSPEGIGFGQTIHDYDPSSGSSCENLQLQIGDNWQTAVDAWVSSPAHYKCLTNPVLTRGAGSVSAYDTVSYTGSEMTTQMYVFAFIATN